MFFWGMLSAHSLDSTSTDALIADTVITQPSESLLADTSAGVAKITDTLPDPNQVAIDAGEQKKEKTKLIKRTFDSRQQVSLGIGMMIFIALIMTTAQSWNPKN